MSDSLREKVFYILEDSDFNDLPYEERKRIGKYLAEQQILTLFQVINKDKANTTETWRKKTTAWLKNCVDSFYHEYRYPSDRKTEPTQNQHIQSVESVESVGEDRKTENSSEKPNICEVKNYCDDCLYTDTCDSKEFFYACTSKATISKMEQVDEPQTERSE